MANPLFDSVRYAGASSGTVTVQGVADAGTWTWYFPTTAGTSGYVLASGGGSGANTWVSPTITINGVACTLGSTATITAAAGSVAVGTTTISGATNSYLLYNNAGTLGNLAVSSLTFAGSAITSGTVSASYLPTFGAADAGIVGASGGGTTNFLRADGSWAAPPGGGGSPGGTNGQIQYNNAGAFGGISTTGSGDVVLATSPTLVTPALGTPASGTLTNATGLPLTTGVTGVLPGANGGTGVNNGSNTITLGGNISTAGAFTTTGAYSVTHTYPGAYTYTFPSATSTLLASTIEDQTVSGGAIVTSKTITLSGTVTLDPGARPLQFGTNGGAVTIAAPSNDGSAAMLITNSASAGAITFSGFSVGSNTGDTYATTSGNKYTLFYWRINGTSGYRWASHQ